MEPVPVLKNAKDIGRMVIKHGSTNSISLDDIEAGEDVVGLTNPMGTRFVYKYETINDYFNTIKQQCPNPTPLQIPDTGETMTNPCNFDSLLDGFKIEVGVAAIRPPIYDTILSHDFLSDQLLKPHKFTEEELNFTDENGDTILHYIIKSATTENVSNIATLLEIILKVEQTKPDLINKVNNDGKTILDIAVEKYGLKKDNEVIRVLINKGATYAPKKGWSQFLNFGGRRTGKHKKSKHAKHPRKTRKHRTRRT